MGRRAIKGRSLESRTGGREEKDLRPNRVSKTPSRRTGNTYAVLAVCGFLLLAVVLVFGQTIQHEFVNYDDKDYVYNNPHIRGGLTPQGIVWAFAHCYAANWHPLTWLSHMLDCHLFGLRPGWHHLTSVLLHAATAVVLFLVMRKMTGRLWIAAAVAALFAVHPLRVESVAWVAERKDVLSGLFFALTLAAYVDYARRPLSIARYLAVLVLSALGLMAKPMLVTLPFVLLLLDYWPLGRFRGISDDGLRIGDGSDLKSEISNPRSEVRDPKLLLLEKLPLVVLAVGSCLITLVAQRKSMMSSEQVDLPWRIANATVSYVAYLGQMVCPIGLTVRYPHLGKSLPLENVAGAVVVLACISTAAVLWRRKRPYLLVGWLWYLGMLAPVIGLVQVGGQAMADRYTYLPQIGIYLAIVCAAAEVIGPSPNRRMAGGLAAAAVLIVLMGLASRQTAYWRDSKTLFTHALECTQADFVAHTSLGVALADCGLRDEAIRHYQRALEIDPNYTEALNNLGVALRDTGKLQQAIPCFQRVLDIKPDHAEAHTNLGNVLRATGQVDAAIPHFEQALKVRPESAETHYNFALALQQQRKFDEAMDHYRQALEIKPDYPLACNNVGIVLAQLGRADEALRFFDRALEIDPACTEALSNSGNVLRDQVRIDEAIERYQRALAILPKSADIRQNLALALFQQGKGQEAVAQLREGLRLSPGDVGLLNRTARVLAVSSDASLRDGAEAVALAGRAVRLTGGRLPALLDTLAAAYAEAGRFPDAVQMAKNALKLARQQNQPRLAKSLQAKLSLYEAGKPFREPPPPATSSPGPR